MSLQRLVVWLSNTAIAVLCLLLIGGWLQSLHPAFDSLSHFRLHLAVLLGVVALALLGFRRFKTALAAIAIVLISLAMSLPYLPGMARGFANPTHTRDWNRLTVVQMNLRFNNRQLNRAISVLRAAGADIFLLQEVTQTTAPVLESVKDTHPYQLACQIPLVGSVAILSRFPFSPNSSQTCLRFDGYASATFEIGGRPVTFISIHSRWPWPAGQSEQFERLENEFGELTKPAIIAGDFNAAPWSHVVNNVAKMAGTTPVSGMKLTWAPRHSVHNRRRKMPLLGDVVNKLLAGMKWTYEKTSDAGGFLPLDHIMHSAEFAPLTREVLGDGGSDHLPVKTVFVWK